MLKKTYFSPKDFIFLAVLFLANLRASFFFPLFPSTTFSPPGLAWVEVLLWLILVFLAAFSLAKQGNFNHYLEIWHRNKFLFLFVLLGLFSIFWSISFSASLFRWLVFFLVTILGAYFAMDYNLSRMMVLLGWGGLIMALLSIFIVFLLPDFGISSGHPYYGAWRGIFWHRNHLGTLMSMFNLVYLFLVVHFFSKDRPQSIFWGVSYLLTLVLIFFSRSATAVIVTVVISLGFLLLIVWLKIRHLLNKKHYYLLVSTLVLTGIAVLVNLDFLFGLLGRDTSLTGRVGLWQYLLEEVVSKRPWFGYGFGAIWNVRSFRVDTASYLQWPFPVLIGDNGFMDILLHLGIVGLVIFLLILIGMGIRAYKIAVYRNGFLSFFPLFFLMYAVLANVAFSLFMETELLVWMVVVQTALNKYENLSADV